MMYLKISYQVWTNEAVVEALELITNIVVASLADDVFQARHHVIDETLVNSLGNECNECGCQAVIKVLSVQFCRHFCI